MHVDKTSSLFGRAVHICTRGEMQQNWWMERAAFIHAVLIVKLLANVAAVLWSSMSTWVVLSLLMDMGLGHPVNLTILQILIYKLLYHNCNYAKLHNLA